MSYLSDIVILILCQLGLVANVLLGLWQTVENIRIGKVSSSQIVLKALVRILLSVYLYLPILQLVGRLIGHYLQSKSETRRSLILARVDADEKKQAQNENTSSGEDEGWEKVGTGASLSGGINHDFRGIIGFFHPFCNAGGGGERVLWAAIKATQERYPNAVCVVYTGDHDATKTDILARVKSRFNIHLRSPKVFFLYLSTRSYVLASTWPRFTLLGQSLGSLVLALDAFSLLVPDIFIDTMGYAFALGCANLCFPDMPTGAYVHYPTISTDMLGSLDMDEGHGVNAGVGRGLKGFAKRRYWQLFAWAYCKVGGNVDVVMANSSWTAAHIQTLWGPNRKSSGKGSDIDIVFPPVAVHEISKVIEVNEDTEAKRDNTFLYIAQFRPEKNHKLILQAFAKLIHESPNGRPSPDTKLVLIGSVRDSDDATRVYELRLFAHELHIKEEVEFICDASWAEILRWLEKSSVGINGMWNEHFGIGVVEYQAAGLISVVNNSGGPKNDIVVDYQGGPTGFHASSPDEYAAAFRKALTLSTSDRTKLRRRARASADRFNENEFAKRWLNEVDKLAQLGEKSGSQSGPLIPQRLTTALAYTAYQGYEFFNYVRK